ncbi:carbamate kinase [Vibrio sp. CAU 1672]|uniref:carbamate kinase n=1 Tax=Vibrio sp. CAU 1672 TaxID=3032594 RepID=UPI0023DA56D8|nr:carbamate kinase [Vibrio sp. CAU 1672]MDF2152989.1 carbamate kinase [Vibrio sp. CAU 1672]
MEKKRIVIALGGNAMIKRGEELTVQNQIKNINQAAAFIQQLGEEYSITLVHGNGPQVGLLALQNLAYEPVPAYPLDVLVSETQGMLGYILSQSLTQHGLDNVVSLLTRVEVDPADPAFATPTKFIGPVYPPEQQQALESQYQWQLKPDGEHIRRVVSSPKPVQVLEAGTISALLEQGHTVICCGGGGMPVVARDNTYHGVEAVIDKDLVAAMLAEQIGADHLLILTDADAVYEEWGTPQQRALRDVTVNELRPFAVPDGAMGPKAEAVIRFVEQTGQVAFIGALKDVELILNGDKGTCIRPASTPVMAEALAV